MSSSIVTSYPINFIADVNSVVHA